MRKFTNKNLGGSQKVQMVTRTVQWFSNVHRVSLMDFQEIIIPMGLARGEQGGFVASWLTKIKSTSLLQR